MPASLLLSTFPYSHGSPPQTSPTNFIFSEFRPVPLHGSGLTTCTYHSAAWVKLILVASKIATIYTDGKEYQKLKVMWNIRDEFNVFSKQCIWGRESFQSLQWVHAEIQWFREEKDLYTLARAKICDFVRNCWKTWECTGTGPKQSALGGKKKQQI